MGKGQGPGAASAGYTGRICHSTAPSPYGWPPAGQPNAAYRVPSSTCDQRWTLGMVATVEAAVVTVEAAVVHLRLANGSAPAVVLALACSTFL